MAGEVLLVTVVDAVDDGDGGCASDDGGDVDDGGDNDGLVGGARESVWVETEVLGRVSVISNVVAVVWVLAVVSEAAEVEIVCVWLETVAINWVWAEIDVVVVV